MTALSSGDCDITKVTVTDKFHCDLLPRWPGLLIQSDGSEQDWTFKPEPAVLPYDDTQASPHPM